jgi:hypothetical protein
MKSIVLVKTVDGILHDDDDDEVVPSSTVTRKSRGKHWLI